MDRKNLEEAQLLGVSYALSAQSSQCTVRKALSFIVFKYVLNVTHLSNNFQVNLKCYDIYH